MPSIVGVVAASRHGVGRGLAIAGAVLGVLGLLICMIWASAIGSAASKAPSYPSSGSYSSISSGSSSAAPTLPAGTYEAGTYAADGELGSINADEIVDGPSTMVVKSSDKYVDFSGDCTWTKK